ncbi:MAG: VOC family protein [Bacteroidota bacterium]
MKSTQFVHKKELFSHAASILPVADLDTSMNFYRDKLGFEITFTWEDPPSYAVLKRGEGVSIHLVRREDQLSPSDRHTRLYIFVYDVDALYKELRDNGLQIPDSLFDTDYGMREFEIHDPDGYRICFGMNVERKV